MRQDDEKVMSQNVQTCKIKIFKNRYKKVLSCKKQKTSLVLIFPPHAPLEILYYCKLYLVSFTSPKWKKKT